MSDNNKVKKISKAKYKPKVSEKKWQDFWDQQNVYKFSPDSPKEVYSIDTPPPTVSGELHLGHLYSYIQAEIFARFQRMNNKNVRYSLGMDNNGLPTERLVEKELKIKGHTMKTSKFVSLCEEITEKYTEKYKTTWKSIGLSVDWEFGYSTISKEVQKYVQGVFKDLFDKQLIYKKKAPAIYCCECQTSFAQAEKESEDRKSIFYDIIFSVGEEKLIIATTRPELLPACVAVFVHPEDKRYKKYVGKKATTPLGNKVIIITDSKVEQEKGSGAVMCCTYGDETDLYWATKYNLNEKILINENGTFKQVQQVKELEGKTIAEARKIIVDFLFSKKLIVNKKHITHAIDVHERCGTPVEYLPTTQWFIKQLECKEKLIEFGKKITWHPEYMKKRYEEWVRGLKWDWCISRERFYGTPIPAYTCNICGHISIAEKQEMPIDPKLTDNKKSCPNCDDGILVAEKSILDTWFTSSLTPDLNNIESGNKELKGKLLPMSMRPHAHDIIRTWTMYTILMSMYNHDEIPWSDVVISGHIMLKKGKKISKKSGGSNFTPEKMISMHSADAIRYAMTGATLGRDSFFDEKEILKGKKLVTKLYNAGKLILLNLRNYDPNTRLEYDELELVDKWIVLKSYEVAESMAEYFIEYNYKHAKMLFEDFFWNDLCDNYLEIIKKRIGMGANNSDSHKSLSAQFASYAVFLNCLKMISPFMPHIAEEMYHGEMLEEETEHERLVYFSSDERNDFFLK